MSAETQPRSSSLQALYLQAIVWFNRKAKSAAVRLTRLTGKSPVAIHPKHLVDVEDSHAWYVSVLQPGMRVLDVGCGNGMHSLRALQRGASSVALDGSDANLQAGMRLAASQGRGWPAFLKADLEQDLPVQSNQFDAALLMDVIEHIYRRPALLAEIHRTLRPDGLLLVSAPNRATRWKRALAAAGLFAYADPDHKIEYSYAELIAELETGGFVPMGEPLLTVYDTPWTGLFDLIGGVSLSLYRRLAGWKARRVQRFPNETTGWRIVCRRV